MPRFSILYYTMSYGIIFHSSILYYPFYQTNLTREDRDAPTRDEDLLSGWARIMVNRRSPNIFQSRATLLLR